MTFIRDALELLTAQHQEIEELLEQVTTTCDDQTFAELADKLTSHLAVEQELFYPVVATQVAPEVMTEVLAEHLAMKRVLADLVWLGVDDADFAPKLARLQALLAGHTAWQEDQLFTTAAETMSEAELAALGDRLHAFDSAVVSTIW